MAASLLDDCRHYEAALYAFVVMQHHVHLMCRLPIGRDSSWFMNRIKSNSAKRLLPHIAPEMRKRIESHGIQLGRALWQLSFRSFPITTDEGFFQKLEYIHSNPVRAKLVSDQRDFIWSSANALEAEIGHAWESGLNVDDAWIARYCDPIDLAFRKAVLNPGRIEIVDSASNGHGYEDAYTISLPQSATDCSVPQSATDRGIR